MTLVAPSLLASDFSRLRDEALRMEHAGADWLHLDVMDGHFVPNITFGPPVIASLRPATKLPFDTHLMIADPDRYLEAFRDAGADGLTVHAEACTHLHRTVARIRELGARPGVSINPATPVSVLEEILPDVDLVLLMTVNPGFGGQRFISGVTEKIRKLKAMEGGRPHPLLIEVDGGIDDVTAAVVTSAGANVLVAGSYVFGAPDASTAIARLRAASAHV